MKNILRKLEGKASKKVSLLKSLSLSAGAWDNKDHKEDSEKFIRSLRESKR